MNVSSGILLFALAMAITPGPNNLMLLTSGLNHGVRKSLPLLLGINVGFIAMFLLVGMGLGTLFVTSPKIHLTIKVCGILYLSYLAYLIAMTPTGGTDEKCAKPLTFLQAALLQWVNPKAWVIATGSVATFTSPDSALFAQILFISAVFLAVGPPCNLVWMLGGVGVNRILRKPKQLRIFNVSMAALLLSSMVPTILELITQFSSFQ